MSSKRVLVGLIALGFAQFAGALVALGSAVGWRLTNPFHYSQDPMLLRLDSPEFVFSLGIVTYVVATAFLVPLLEARAMAATRRGLVVAAGLLPVVGVAAYFSCSANAGAVPVLKTNQGGQTIPGAIGVGLAGLTLIGGIIFIIDARDPFAEKPRVETDVANRAAYALIRDIVRAQSTYIEDDWDGDGEHEYALFVAHLWRTARKKKPSVDVRLLPEELAVSRTEDFAHQGFEFRNVHHREVTSGGKSFHWSLPPVEKIDYAKYWALTAEPTEDWKPDDEHYRLQFLALSDQGIFARKRKGQEITYVPLDLKKDWSPVNSVADIERLQSKTIEPAP